MKNIAVGIGLGLTAMIAVGTFIATSSATAVAGVGSTLEVAHAAPLPVLAQRELQLSGGASAIVLSVREPAQLENMQALVDTRRAGHSLVRVFVYAASATPEQDNPLRRYDWTAAGGLIQTGQIE